MGGARSATRRVPPLDAPHHRASLGILLALLLVLSTGRPCHGRGGQDDVPGGKMAGGKCMERERQALLAVRDDVWGVTDDPSFPSWERDGDCCRWKGVACDHRSGHVIKLDLQCPEGKAPGTHESKVSPSLLNLGSLRYLDLRGNSFGGARLPSFIGSLVNLEYLNISRANFAGSVPPELGNLRNLKSLDVSYVSSNMVVENFHWLFHLSDMQYLDMSGLNLSAAHDWLQVISMLPSLSVLRLQYCDLPNPPSTLPLGNFTSLSTLDLGGSDLGYFTWPLWLSNISSLTTLVLRSRLNCTMPPDAFKSLKHLEVLSLDGYDFRGLIPSSLWRLNKLKTLYLSGYGLRIVGSSEEMGQLSGLQELTILSSDVDEWPDSPMRRRSLSINHDGISIELPESIGNLSRLEHLEVTAYGTMPESVGKLTELKILSLQGINASREVLRNMGDLCNLTELTIGGNMANGAEVTRLFEGLSECTKGSALEHLDISRNGYGGHLPDQIGKLKNLRYVDLSGNSIVGSIPASIGELESLTYLDLSNNQLSGLVPSSIGKLSNLTSMYISSNRLEGALSEAHFSHLSQLGTVDLSHNAALSLNTSQAWIPPFQLSSFEMSACHVGPEFPKWFQTQENLYRLDLSSNNISCILEDDFINKFSYLGHFNLSHNDIKGILPASLLLVSPTIDLSFNSFEASPLVLNVSSVCNLFLSHNLISGLVFLNTEGLQFLDLSHNKIQGSIPSAICQIERLNFLDLSYNQFLGQLPNCWKSSSLVILQISNNFLVGPIPSSIGMLSQIKLLHLEKNALTGFIPLSLKNCINLETLDLSENKLSGEIPSWLGQSLSSLKILSLRSNMFHGYLPMSLSELQSLKILDLACNKFSGSILLSFHNLSEMVNIETNLESYKYAPHHALTIQSTYYKDYTESVSIVSKGTELQYTVNLPLVTMIDLSDNNFSGEFPTEIITSLPGLCFLNLSRNHLRGRIPENINTMRLLESLDLSFNQLFGKLPSTMSTMHFLSVFNVSYNSLSGRIPSGQIQNFDQSSFIGNLDLCGAPILGPCPGDATFQDPFPTSEGDASEHESYMAWFYVSLGPGFITGFLGFVGVLSLMRRSWRIAYFRFFDDLGGTLYVIVVVRYARLKVKLSAWRRGGSAD